MCGIAGGIWSEHHRGIDRAILRSMTDAIAHRGPDDQGAWLISPTPKKHLTGSQSVPGVALGFRRLSIIDLASGNQPMANEDGTIRLVFNGEIYNYRDLRHRLEGSGHQFISHSDTETIVHLYEDLGTDCFRHFNGMFAIAIWDSVRERLVLARDRLGKKPLYYWHDGEQLVFASELKALVQVPGFPREIDPGAIDTYLTYQYIPYPYTIYRGVSKLPPGHWLVYEKGRIEIQRYWDVDWTKEVPVSLSDAKHQLHELLDDAIRLRLRSDVPLGAFLSGGIDSSLIVALAQKQLEEPIRTFSIGFSEADYDETGFAKMVADHVGTNHQRFEVQPDALGIIDALVKQYDEPFSDSSAVPTWYLSQMTGEAVTVALSGDGGDELFGGYERYRALELSERMQRWLPVGWIRESSWLKRLPDSTARRSFLRRVRRFCEALGQSSPDRYMNWIQIFGEANRLDLYQDSFIQRLPDRDPASFLRSAWGQSIASPWGDVSGAKAAQSKRDPMSCAMAADLQTYIPCDLMTKVDIASMAHSLEARQPFLDYRLVEWASSLPVQWKMRAGRGKWLLYETYRELLPAAIWNRPKMGFGVPIGKWFRTSLRDRTYDALLANDTHCLAIFRRESIERLVTEHMSGNANHQYRLWNLLMLELWLRHWPNRWS
ncbi:MAG: asparagine synthase (glutamine-hydrolyzing) [Planctomycetota bacterium]